MMMMLWEDSERWQLTIDPQMMVSAEAKVGSSEASRFRHDRFLQRPCVAGCISLLELKMSDLYSKHDSKLPMVVGRSPTEPSWWWLGDEE